MACLMNHAQEDQEHALKSKWGKPYADKTSQLSSLYMLIII